MSSILRVDKILPVDGIVATSSVGSSASNNAGGTGGSIQTVYYQGKAYSNGTAGYVTTSTQSMIATGFYVNITPKFATSKIRLDCHFHSWATQGGQTDDYVRVTIYRNSTNLAPNLGQGSTDTMCWIGDNDDNATANDFRTWSFIDTPNTTSQIKYEIYMRTSNGQSHRYGWSSDMNAIIATELSA
tara:strand:+ start:474 stop:1031 length:558 start_codon:yes stop_codon:yes gene_type:complete